MWLFIFLLLGSQVDFHLMGQYWFGGSSLSSPSSCWWPVRQRSFSARCPTAGRNGVSTRCCSCAGRAVRVTAALAGLLLGMKAPGAPVIASVTIAILDDDPHSGADHQMAGPAPGADAIENRETNDGRQSSLQQSKHLGQAARLQLRGPGNRAEPADLPRRSARLGYGEQVRRRTRRTSAPSVRRRSRT